MRAFTDSFIVSNPGQNYAVSKLHHCITYSVKNTHSLQEKWLSQLQRGILVSRFHNLMGEFFRLLWRNVNAYRKDRKCFKIVQTNGLSVEENTDALECTAQNNSIFAFASGNIIFFILGSMDELFKPRERLKRPAVIRNSATDRNRPIVYIWWSWKLIYIWLY